MEGVDQRYIIPRPQDPIPTHPLYHPSQPTLRTRKHPRAQNLPWEDGAGPRRVIRSSTMRIRGRGRLIIRLRRIHRLVLLRLCLWWFRVLGRGGLRGRSCRGGISSDRRGIRLLMILIPLTLARLRSTSRRRRSSRLAQISIFSTCPLRDLNRLSFPHPPLLDMPPLHPVLIVPPLRPVQVVLLRYRRRACLFRRCGKTRRLPGRRIVVAEGRGRAGRVRTLLMLVVVLVWMCWRRRRLRPGRDGGRFRGWRWMVRRGGLRLGW